MFLLTVFPEILPIAKDPQSVTHYTDNASELGVNTITYFVDVTKIDKFEKLNFNISVNIFVYIEQLYPLRISNHRGREYHQPFVYMRSK